LAKVSGLGGAVLVQDAASAVQTITNDITNYAFTTPRAVQDVTGVDKPANERILLLADYSVTLNGVFNQATNMSHAVFSTIPSTNVTRSVELDVTGVTTGLPVMKVNCLLTDYQITRAATGELTFQVPGQLADGATPTWTLHA
jgi:hypothetical protein